MFTTHRFLSSENGKRMLLFFLIKRRRVTYPAALSPMRIDDLQGAHEIERDRRQCRDDGLIDVQFKLAVIKCVGAHQSHQFTNDAGTI